MTGTLEDLLAVLRSDPKFRRTRDGRWYLAEWGTPWGRPHKLILLTKEDLYDLYITQELSTYAIAKLLDVSPQLIQLRLKEFGIPSRYKGRK